MIITVDGPAGSGKSTAAKLLAHKLGFAYLDTGAMYRAVALAALQEAVNLDDAQAVTALGRNCNMQFVLADKCTKVILTDKDVSSEIRTPEVTQAASKLAGVGQLREVLVSKQRQIAQTLDNLVTEGRDQGSVVFPDAELKFFLDARAQVRAERRYKELLQQHRQIDLQQVVKDLAQRDSRDTLRKVAPLTVPENAIEIDTSDMTVEQVVERLIEYAQPKLNNNQTASP